MIALIAESKTMNKAAQLFAAEELRDHRPLFQQEADEIMRSLQKCDADEIARILKVSVRYAADVVKQVYDFNMPGTALRVTDAFTGVVFRSARIPLMRESDMDWIRGNLMICSSLYGLLRMENLIKPYRLDYKLKLPMLGGDTLSKFWKPKVTIALGRMLKGRSGECVVNLMPADASACFDWKLLKSFASVAVIDFKRVADGGKLVTPGSVRLKELRGEFVRYLAAERPQTIQDLRRISTDNFAYDCDTPYSGILRFVCD